MQVTKSNKSRDPYIDNARFILVVLVVFGHLISPLRGEHDAIYWLNNFLQSFRMPALILITGYFAKSFYREGYIEKITIKLFVPFLLFQVFYAYVNYVIFEHSSFSVNWFTPYMGMWFLLSLYCWNLLIFIFSKLKHPIAIAFILGIVIGFVADAGAAFGIMRTFVFFPFFLIGFYVQKEHLEWLKTPIFKLISIGAVLLSLFLLYNFPLLDAREMLLGKSSYHSIDISNSTGIIRRSIFYLIMSLGVLTFLPWVPKRKLFFTIYGQRTAYIYLLHFIFIKLVDGIDWTIEVKTWMIVFTPFIAFGLSIILCSKPVMYITKPFVEGGIVNLLKKPFQNYGGRLKSEKI